MDSLMANSSYRKLSRLEIIYSTVARLIQVIDKNTTLPKNFKPHLKEGHYNVTVYLSRDKDLNSKIKGHLHLPEFFSIWPCSRQT